MRTLLNQQEFENIIKEVTNTGIKTGDKEKEIFQNVHKIRNACFRKTKIKEKMIKTRQECIPVGCVPSAAVAVSPATHAPLPPRTPLRHACSLPCMPPCHVHPLPCMPPCHACPSPARHVPPL